MPILCRISLLSVILFTFSPDSRAETLWDRWYTIQENGKVTRYYNEKVTELPKKIKIQVNTWKLTDNKLAVETLGATAENSKTLPPLIYHFQGTDGRVIDGSVIENGKVFSVKIKNNDQKKSRPLRAEMLPKLILSSFFPVWVHQNQKRINGVQPIEFHAIVEDQVQTEVPVVKGTAYEMDPDQYAKKHNLRKLEVRFNAQINYWYLDQNGVATRIMIPESNILIESTTKTLAQKSIVPKLPSKSTHDLTPGSIPDNK